MVKDHILNFYEKHYKKILFVPIIILILALAQIATQIYFTGDFVNKGVSLKGGSTITFTKNFDPVELQDYLSQQFKGAEISVRTLTQAGSIIAVAVETDAQDEEEINSILSVLQKKYSFEEEDYTTEIIGASLSQSFFRQTIIAIIITFILMGFVVFVYFRTPVPSLAVILCAFSDIVVTLAVFNLIGQKLSTAGIAAFLMLIGYSVDTDILLTTRIIKRKEGSVMERLVGAFKTGMTMTLTTLVAVVLALIFAESPVIKQIMLILLIGLLTDIFFTWLQNTSILKWYVERKHKPHETQKINL